LIAAILSALAAILVSLWSRLVWEIRDDLGDPPKKSPDTFQAMLWASCVRSEADSK